MENILNMKLPHAEAFRECFVFWADLRSTREQLQILDFKCSLLSVMSFPLTFQHFHSCSTGREGGSKKDVIAFRALFCRPLTLILTSSYTFPSGAFKVYDVSLRGQVLRHFIKSHNSLLLHYSRPSRSSNDCQRMLKWFYRHCLCL